MTLEFILWITAWVVISEGIFIVWSLIDSNREHGFMNPEMHWVGKKVIAFLGGGAFVLIQVAIVFCGEENPNVLFETAHYINLLYEAIVLGVIGVLFLCNWLISKKIEERNEKKGKK